MTDNEKRLAHALLSVYRTVRMQQVAISALMIREAALRDAVSVSPNIQIELEKTLEKHSTGTNARTLSATLELIDGTIASLEQTFGPWKN